MVTFGKMNWTANVEAPSNDRVLLMTSRPGASEKHKEFRMNVKTDANLWYGHFDAPAVLPEPLKQKFTKYSLLLQAVRNYYDKKEIDVKEL